MATRREIPALLKRKAGDVVAVAIGDDLFCYVRKYAFGHGVLPFVSQGGVLRVEQLPTTTSALFFDVWVYETDPTPMHFIGSFPFATAEESWGKPAFEPPDKIEPCFKIHGVFNGLFSIIKPVKEEETAGLRLLKNYQPLEFRAFLSDKRQAWPTISAHST
jgi:hypothetical protein